MFVRRVAIVGWNPFYKKANFLCPQGATCCWSGSTARKRHARRSTWSTWETEGTPWRTRPRSPASTCSSSSGARTISQEAPSTSLFPKSIWSHFRCRISRLKLSSLLRARSAYRLPDLIITVDNVCSFCTAMISKGTAWNLPETTASLLASCTAMPPCCCCSPCTILRVRKFIRAASYVVARHLARTLLKATRRPLSESRCLVAVFRPRSLFSLRRASCAILLFSPKCYAGGNAFTISGTTLRAPNRNSPP